MDEFPVPVNGFRQQACNVTPPQASIQEQCADSPVPEGKQVPTVTQGFPDLICFVLCQILDYLPVLTQCRETGEDAVTGSLLPMQTCFKYSGYIFYRNIP